jgi:hypothetical protein
MSLLRAVTSVILDMKVGHFEVAVCVIKLVYFILTKKGSR